MNCFNNDLSIIDISINLLFDLFICYNLKEIFYEYAF